MFEPVEPRLFLAATTGLSADPLPISPSTVSVSFTAPGPITYTAPDEATAGDDLRVLSGVIIESTGASVDLNGGDDVVVEAGAVVSAATSITVRGDHANADPGVGSTVTSAGALNAPEVAFEGGTDADTFNVLTTQPGTATTIEPGAGAANTVNIGSAADQALLGLPGHIREASATDRAARGGVLDNIADTIRLIGGGADILTVDDSGSIIAKTGGLSFVNDGQGIPYSQIAGMGMGGDGIECTDTPWVYMSLSQGPNNFAVAGTFAAGPGAGDIVISASDAGDTLWVLDAHAVTTLNGRGGDDTFITFGSSEVSHQYGNAGDDTFLVFASAAPGGGQNVNITGGDGFDRLVISLTVLGDELTIDAGRITGSGIDIVFAGIEELVVIGLAGADSVQVKALTIPLLVHGDGARPDLPTPPPGVVLPDPDAGQQPSEDLDDTIFVGWSGPGLPADLAPIQSPVVIFGDGGFDTVYIDNTADLASRNIVFDAGIFAGDTPAPVGTMTDTMRNVQVSIGGSVEDLNLWLGQGNDTITVSAVMASVQTSVSTGRGDDTITINAPLMHPLAVEGEGNAFTGDRLIVNASESADTFIVTGFTIEGTGETIRYGTMESLQVNALGGDDTVAINGTSIPTTIAGGDGADAITANASNSPLAISGGNDADAIAVLGNSATLVASGDEGDDTFLVDGNSGIATLNGGNGADGFTVNGSAGLVFANGEGGDDSIVINGPLTSPVTATGGTGSDSFTLNANSASVTLRGNEDADTFLVAGNTGSATLNGGDGDDTITIDVNHGTLVANGDGDADTLTVNANNARITLSGGAGDDLLSILGNSGTLTANGDTGNDDFRLDVLDAAPVTANGGADDDEFFVSGWNTPATLNGGDDYDTVIAHNDADAALTDATLSVAGKAPIALSGIEAADLAGGAADNTFTLTGWTGDGLLDGMGGANTLRHAADADLALTDISIAASNGLSMTLAGIQTAHFTGGPGANAFTLTGWTGNGSIDALDGDDSLIFAADANMTLTDASFTATTGISMTLASVQAAHLTGGGSSNAFTVSGWTGTGSIAGLGGPADTLISVNDADFTLADNHLHVSHGASLNLSGIEDANLTGGPGPNRFTISDWTGGGTLDGQGGQDRIVSARDADYTLLDTAIGISGGASMLLSSIETADLAGGPGVNSFVVSGWTGTGTLDGLGGDDFVISSNNADFALSNTAFNVMGGASFGLTSVEVAHLDGGAGDNTFTLTGWTGSGSFSGMASTDTLIHAADADMTLSDAALGSSSGLRLNLHSLETATLTGGDSANAFAVADWTGTAFLFGAGGDDTYTITLGGTVAVNDTGTSEGDALIVNGTPGADTISLSHGRVSAGAALVTYNSRRPVPAEAIIASMALDGIEQVTVNGLGGGDAFNATANSTPTAINAGGGASLLFNALGLPVTAGPGSIDVLNGAPLTYTGIGQPSFINVPTQTTLSTDLNPVRLYYPVTFTAVVTPLSSGLPQPAGTVTFLINGVEQPPVTVVNSTATLTTSALPVAVHTITARYDGDASLLPGMSSAIEQEVIHPQPVLAAIWPVSVARGKAASVQIGGSDFTAASTVVVGGRAVATTFVDRYTLRADLSDQDTARAGFHAVFVRTAKPGGGDTVTVASLTVLSPVTEIIDNGDSRYRTLGVWQRQSGGYKKDADVAGTGSQKRYAAWTFQNLTPGLYRVSATWKASPSLAFNAPFTAFDGNRKLGNFRIDQTVRPSSRRAGKTWWQDLDTFTVRNGLLTVRLTARGREAVLADAVHIERVETGIFPIKKTASAPRATAAALKASAFSAAPSPAAAPAAGSVLTTRTTAADGTSALFCARPLLGWDAVATRADAGRRTRSSSRP